MQQYVDAGESLCVRRYGECPAQRGAIGTPSDGDEERIETTAHSIYASEEVFQAGLGFGGEELEGVVPWR